VTHVSVFVDCAGVRSLPARLCITFAMARQRKGRRNGGNDKTDAKPTVSPSAVTSSRGGNDDDDYMVVDYAGRHGVCYNLFQFVTNMVMYHYLMWWIPMVGFLYLLHLWGPLGDLLAAVCLLIYLPSFFSRAPFVKGRPWPWLRRLPFWNVMQNYLSIRLVRTKKLDPDDQYVFGFHPHGILVLSRVATCTLAAGGGGGGGGLVRCSL